MVEIGFSPLNSSPLANPKHPPPQTATQLTPFEVYEKIYKRKKKNTRRFGAFLKGHIIHT